MACLEGITETACMRARDWASTSLGPIADWPPVLRHTVDLLLAHPLPMGLLWGPDLIHIYNDGYAEALGQEHPASFGQPLRDSPCGLMHLNQPILDRLWAGETLRLEDAPFPIACGDAAQDNWYVILHSPVRDEQGHVAGILLTLLDRTGQMRAEARLRTAEDRQVFLLRLSDALRPLTDPAEVQRTAMRLVRDRFSANRALYYEVSPDGDTVTTLEGSDDGPYRMPAHFRLSEFGAWMKTETRAGRPPFSVDVDCDPRVDAKARAVFHATGARSFVGSPLYKDGRLVVVIGISCPQPHSWSEDELLLLEEVAERTWEAVERARAESASRRSEERLQLALDAASMGTFLWHLDSDITEHDQRSWELFGEPAGGKVNPSAAIMRLIHPDDRERGDVALRSALEARNEGRFRQEFRICLPDGTIRWLMVSGQAVPDDSGRAAYVGGTVRDVTAERQAREALRDSEERLATIFETLPVGVGVMDVDGVIQLFNREMARFATVASPYITQSLRWRAWNADGQPMEANDFPGARALRGERVLPGTEMLYTDEHGREIWVDVAAAPLRNSMGELTGQIAVVTDITPLKMSEQALRLSEERLRLLVAELQHRVRNILTVVRSVFARTTGSGGNAEEMADHFRGRLDALARTQAIVTQTATGTADLENLIRDELMSVGVRDGPDVRIAGPDVALTSEMAESLGLAIHELTTNALKYGALKVDGARLCIDWTVGSGSDGAPRLLLRWEEQGVPAIVLTPLRIGFGRELIEEALPYRLGAQTALEFRGGGVRCTISIPLGCPDLTVEPVNQARPVREI